MDDGSTDDSLKIIQEFTTLDSRVRVFHQENAGAGSARNLGIKEARGEYIFFLDSDDSLCSYSVLQDLYDIAKKNKADVCGGRLLILDDNGIHLEEMTDLKEEGFFCFDQHQWHYYFTRFIYKSSMIRCNELWFPEVLVYEDPIFWLNVMSVVKKYYYKSINVYLYDQRGKNNKTTYSEKALKGFLLCIIQDSNYVSKTTGIIFIMSYSMKLVYGPCFR